MNFYWFNRNRSFSVFNFCRNHLFQHICFVRRLNLSVFFGRRSLSFHRRFNLNWQLLFLLDILFSNFLNFGKWTRFSFYSWETLEFLVRFASELLLLLSDSTDLVQHRDLCGAHIPIIWWLLNQMGLNINLLIFNDFFAKFAFAIKLLLLNVEVFSSNRRLLDFRHELNVLWLNVHLVRWENRLLELVLHLLLHLAAPELALSVCRLGLNRLLVEDKLGLQLEVLPSGWDWRRFDA